MYLSFAVSTQKCTFKVDADSKLKSPFLSASSFLPTIVGKLDRSTLIEFYALYKQATCGPASKFHPNLFICWCDFESAGERELLLWFTAAKADDETTIMEIFILQMTALHWAIDSGCDKVINFLISNGVDVNVVDPEGNTPLHFAAYCCRQAAAEILIAKGADRSVRNSDGQTAADACDDPTLRLILTPPST
ncbi:unnamed protein product [Heligmosomoides polygyrus]|uniref:ANK_REP_REGION domain-containing protein n=1 Tax=Heligmosomoides polygyrus TaxID=6339 RepID=A0A3P8CEB2_HELPZ|nr:unnamed protein product [Heligmosomoides polygyrus]